MSGRSGPTRRALLYSAAGALVVGDRALAAPADRVYRIGVVSAGIRGKPQPRKGLPTFCDKPIGGTVAGTRKVLEFARKHKAPLMSSSLFRHEWGMEAALRKRDDGKLGPIQYVIADLQSGYTLDSWMIYGQH